MEGGVNGDGDLLNWLVKGLIGVSVTVNGIFTGRLLNRVTELERDGTDCKVNLANFKAEVAKDYAREVNVQASLNRLHDRLDKLPGEIVGMLERRK